MKWLIVHIDEETTTNDNFKKVLFTSNYLQLAVMSLDPGEDIGEESHGQDQFIRIEEGEGKIILNGQEFLFSKDFAVVIPAGIRHNVVNTSMDSKLKLYTIFSPPFYRFDTIHLIKPHRKGDKPFDGVVG